MSAVAEKGTAEAAREERKRELISQEAAEWFARMQDPDLPDDDRKRFVRWLKQSQTHIAEMMLVAGIAHDLRRTRLSRTLRSPMELPLPPPGVPIPLPRLQTTDGQRGDNPKTAALERLKWLLVEAATDRDLALWAEDGLPAKSRIELASKPMPDLPDERTLKFMAKYERERRSKRSERNWWIVGVIATGLLSPIVVELAKGLVSGS